MFVGEITEVEFKDACGPAPDIGGFNKPLIWLDMIPSSMYGVVYWDKARRNYSGCVVSSDGTVADSKRGIDLIEESLEFVIHLMLGN